MSRGGSHLRRWIARGYRPRAPAPPEVEAVLTTGSGGGTEALPPAAAVERLRPSAGGIAVLLPTFVGRFDAEARRAAVAHVADQLAEVRQRQPDLPLLLIVALQWRGTGEREEALRALERLGSVPRGPAATGYLGLALRGPGKPASLNAAIGVAEALELRGLAWVDDDVRMEPGCLERMIRRFRDKGCRGAVGATKIPVAKSHLASRLLFRAKAVTTPACDYPHGCCILVAPEVVAGGIPPRYVSDDGYVCFRLLDPGRDDPLELLELVPEARCRYHVGGPLVESYRRIRRALLNHHVFLADWPPPVSRYYFRRLLFYGLWPLAPWDGSRGFLFGLRKCALKAVYFIWFASVGAELYLRGLLGRPLERLRWRGYSRYQVPDGPPPGSSRPATADPEPPEGLPDEGPWNPLPRS